MWISFYNLVEPQAAAGGKLVAMCGHELVKVESEKDLGIIFSKNLKVSVQCNEAYSKANRMLDWSAELLSTGMWNLCQVSTSR